MLTVACVLRSGGAYDAEYVQRLRKSVEYFTITKHRFVCLSDVEIEGVETIPLETDWPTWWGKLELFRNFKGKTLYLDLDTVLRDTLEVIVSYPHKFTMLADFNPNGTYKENAFGSGVMAWEGDYSYLADRFTLDSAKEYNRTGKWGDQDWIRDNLGFTPDTFQRIAPGSVASYKWHSKAVKENASVICYHGKPKPRDTGWAV